ncbi:MAG: TolC family protein [Capsulimonadaceae bacterium]|nr:TolC family protein [Capsulimonadaceae bacterium]
MTRTQIRPRANQYIPLAILATYLLSPAAASAEPANPPAGQDLTIAGAVAIALANSLDIATAKRDVAVARAQNRFANSLRLPKASALASQLHLGEPLDMAIPSYTMTLPMLGSKTISLPEMELAKQDETRMSVQVALPIYTSGAIENTVTAAKYGERANAKALDAKANDVAIDVVQDYLRASLAAQIEQVQREGLDDVRRHLDDTQKLFDAGVVAKYDVLRAQKELASQEKRVTDAANQRDLATLALLNAMHVPLSTPVNLASPLVNRAYAQDTDAAIKQAISSSNVTQALRYKAKSQEALGRATGAQDKPTVTALAMHNVIQQDLTALEPNSFVMLAVNWPLYDGGAAKALADQQHQQAAKSLDDAQKAEDLIQMGVHQASDDLASGQKGLASADEGLALAEEGLRLASRRFETGVGTSVEKIDAILGVSQARVERANALYQIDSAYYRLLNLTNLLLADLQTPFSPAKENTK